MEKQEKRLDDIEQEITPPKNRKNGKHKCQRKNCELARPAWMQN